MGAASKPRTAPNPEAIVPAAGGALAPMVERQKIRVLIVSFNLGQGGSERFLFELCKAFDRDRFDIEILTKYPTTPPEYYEPRLRELGIPIHHKMPRFLHLVRRFARPFFVFRPTRAIVETIHRLWMRFSIGGLLDRFDVIEAIQIENYYLVQPLVKNNDKIIIHLMSHAVQYDVSPYADCLPGRSYRFVLFDPAQKNDLASLKCLRAETFDFPLALATHSFPDLSTKPKTSARYRIAIFQRLHPKEHPFSGFFQALRHILDVVDAELVIYGRGDPAVFDSELLELNIRDRVTFVGHTASIERALREDQISLVWQISIGKAIGYSSIEIGAYGFPVLLWNITGCEADPGNSDGFRTFHDPKALADETLRLLNDPGEQRAAGAMLRQYVIRNYDIYGYMPSLEAKLMEIAREAGGPVAGSNA
jgi:glycosyltransferase involved in cell wall biosynthesis